MVYQVEKMLSENREKLAGSDVQTLEGAIGDARKAMEQGGVDNLRKALDNLQKASHKLAEVMYQQTAQQQGGGEQSASGGESTSSNKDDVIEAEVVDENK